MSGRIVTGALVATALGVGVLVGLAAPKGTMADDASAAPDARQLQVEAELATTQGWVTSLADAAVADRVTGLRVALLVTDGTPDATVHEVTAALERGGANVAATARLGDAWWNSSMASFRGELASQVSASVVGADGLGGADLLHHAILQAIVPGALPRGTADPAGAADGTGADGTPADGTGTDAKDGEVADGATRQEVLLEVLTRAEILTLDHPATDGVDALIIVTADGPEGEGAPEGAGAAMSATAAVWEQYLGATEIVFAGMGEMGTVEMDAGEKGAATDTIAAATDTPKATRPSIVVISDPSLAAAQVVLALKEQSTGGTGTYGTAKGLDLLAIP